jgi:hypothetical protein
MPKHFRGYIHTFRSLYTVNESVHTNVLPVYSAGPDARRVRVPLVEVPLKYKAEVVEGATDLTEARVNKYLL